MIQIGSSRSKSSAFLGILSIFLALAEPALADPVGAPGKTVAVHIAGIRAIAPEQVLLLLADESETRAVPIAVGRDQGIAIYLGKERTRTPRPMTHDLMGQILRTLGASVERVTVTELKNDTYYATLSIRLGRKEYGIDARPSDAVALAVRLDAPIFASEDLLRSMREPGLSPEQITSTDGRLGLSVQYLDRDMAEFLGAVEVSGVLVSRVVDGGRAEIAGLRRGDILRQIDGHPTGGIEEYMDALERAGDRVRFRVWREGEILTLPPP